MDGIGKKGREQGRASSPKGRSAPTKSPAKASGTPAAPSIRGIDADGVSFDPYKMPQGPARLPIEPAAATGSTKPVPPAPERAELKEARTSRQKHAPPGLPAPDAGSPGGRDGTVHWTAELHDALGFTKEQAEVLAKASGSYGLAQESRSRVLAHVIDFIGAKRGLVSGAPPKVAGRDALKRLTQSPKGERATRPRLLYALERLVAATVRGDSFVVTKFVRGGLLCHMDLFADDELAHFEMVDEMLRERSGLRLNLDASDVALATAPLMKVYQFAAARVAALPEDEQAYFFADGALSVEPLYGRLLAASEASLQLLRLAADDTAAYHERRALFAALANIDDIAQAAGWQRDACGLHLEPAGQSREPTPAMVRINHLLARWSEVEHDTTLREAVTRLPLLLDDDDGLFHDPNFMALVRNQALVTLSFAAHVSTIEQAEAAVAMRMLLHHAPSATWVQDFAQICYPGQRSALFELFDACAGLPAAAQTIILRFATAAVVCEAPITPAEIRAHLFEQPQAQLSKSDATPEDVLALLMQPLTRKLSRNKRPSWLAQLDGKLRVYGQSSVAQPAAPQAAAIVKWSAVGDALKTLVAAPSKAQSDALAVALRRVASADVANFVDARRAQLDENLKRAVADQHVAVAAIEPLREVIEAVLPPKADARPSKAACYSALRASASRLHPDKRRRFGALSATQEEGMTAMFQLLTTAMELLDNLDQRTFDILMAP